MAVDLELHDTVKRRLRAANVSFVQIAAELSVSPSLVTMVSQGHRSSLPIAWAIARHLHQKPSDIWSRYDQEEENMLITKE